MSKCRRPAQRRELAAASPFRCRFLGEYGSASAFSVLIPHPTPQIPSSNPFPAPCLTATISGSLGWRARWALCRRGFRRCRPAPLGQAIFSIHSVALVVRSRVWVRRRQVRVAANSVARNVACGRRFATANNPSAHARLRAAQSYRYGHRTLCPARLWPKG